MNSPPPLRTRSALLKPIAWRPEPLDVVLVLGFLLLIVGVALRFSVPDALLTAGALTLAAWAKIAYTVQESKEQETKSGG